MKVAFDVDGTLVLSGGLPNGWVIEMLIGFYKAGHKIIVWSGGGAEYAEQICRDLELGEFVSEYLHKVNNPGDIDTCFDDQEVNLAKTNIIVSAVDIRANKRGEVMVIES